MFHSSKYSEKSHKGAGHFDLPIALGILIASGQVPVKETDRFEFAGELSLTGELRPIRGALAISLAARKAERSLVVPTESAAEAALCSGAEVLPADNLLAVCAHLMGHAPLAPTVAAMPELQTNYPDLSDVRGQVQAKRALEVAAAGNHSLLMSGPPGTGKSMLASRFPGLLPPMSNDEAFEAAAVQSLAGSFQPARWAQRPYRFPHHSSSTAALVGGGSVPRPGEISLAHGGVLFLDELPEFDRRVLEALREPLETGSICISRAARQADFPARFQLIAAMNPCPCGYQGHASGKCRCTPDQVSRYRAELSGPLLDRIDLMIDVPAVAETDLRAGPTGESSAAVRERVEAARQRQTSRQGCANAQLSNADIDSHCRLDTPASQLLAQAMARLNLSARAYHRILKVARTIADLASQDTITSAHVAEAIQYRRGLHEA